VKITVVDPGNFTPLYDANLCHCLATRGHTVKLATSEFLFEPVPPLQGYQVENAFFRHVARMRPLKGRRLARQALKAAVYPIEIARWSSNASRPLPDVVHVQWSMMPLLDARIYARLRRAGARVVYTAHDVQPLPGSTWSGAGFSALYRLADAVIVHADEGRRRLVDGHGVVASRVHVVPMGGPGAYTPQLLPRDEARTRLGLQPDAPYVLFFGLIKKYKGLDVLLEALSLALRERPDLRLLVAGEPMGSWRPYGLQIARLGLGRSVDLHLGFVPSERTPLYFGAADVVVLPYREIFQSGIVLAAYTHERPVVATRVGGLPEVVREGVTGYLTPPDDPGALGATLLRAISDPNGLAGMGAAAAALVRERHSWEQIAARHEEIYEETMRKTRRSAASAQTGSDR
jgi:D-inositol-3-phosphate glycosyltransferase